MTGGGADAGQAAADSAAAIRMSVKTLLSALGAVGTLAAGALPIAAIFGLPPGRWMASSAGIGLIVIGIAILAYMAGRVLVRPFLTPLDLLNYIERDSRRHRADLPFSRRLWRYQGGIEHFLDRSAPVSMHGYATNARDGLRRIIQEHQTALLSQPQSEPDRIQTKQSILAANALLAHADAYATRKRFRSLAIATPLALSIVAIGGAIFVAQPRLRPAVTQPIPVYAYLTPAGNEFVAEEHDCSLPGGVKGWLTAGSWFSATVSIAPTNGCPALVLDLTHEAATIIPAP